MARVAISFKPYFKKPMLRGVKVCTARTKKKGQELDSFQAFGVYFCLTYICKIPLRVAATLWKQEGCRSMKHFIAVWKSIHPKTGYDPNQVVWLHKFKKVEEEV